MTEAELQNKIDRFKDRVRFEVAQTRNEEQFQEFFLSGLDILGELLMDIKRATNK